jgi:DNA-3-methyladenine glycosylase II
MSSRVRRGVLDLEQLDALDDEQVAERLMGLPGVGRWTADMLLMFSLGRMDILPIGDLALRKSIRMHYRLPEDADADIYLEVAERWRPYRTVASWYCWAAVD